MVKRVQQQLTNVKFSTTNTAATSASTGTLARPDRDHALRIFNLNIT